MKLSHALEGFWLSKRLDFSAATIQNYERVFREFLACLGDREMDAITSDDIRRYLDYLHKRRKLSKRSVHSHRAILSSLWSWAEWELQIPHIIRGNIPAPSYRKRAIIPFTQDEIKRLLGVNPLDETSS
jgi:site-specific recombinase XerD